MAGNYNQQDSLIEVITKIDERLERLERLVELLIKQLAPEINL